MRIDAQSIRMGYGYTNNRNAMVHPVFKSWLYNPKSILHKTNPVIYYLDEYLQRALNVSRVSWHSANQAIAPYVKEITTKTKKGVPIKLWDINKDSRKKYVIVMHGLSHNISRLQNLYEGIIKKTNFAVLAAEYRGYERDSKEFVYHNPKELLEDGEAALKYLKDKNIDSKDIFILGHSFGGFSASKLAQKHDELGGVILVSSTDMFNRAKYIISKKPNIPQKIKKIAASSSLFKLPLNFIFNAGGCLKRTSIPTDIIHSKSDKLIDLEAAQSLAHKAKNLNSFSIIEGTHKMDTAKINKIIELLNEK